MYVCNNGCIKLTHTLGPRRFLTFTFTYFETVGRVLFRRNLCGISFNRKKAGAELHKIFRTYTRLRYLDSNCSVQCENSLKRGHAQSVISIVIISSYRAFPPDINLTKKLSGREKEPGKCIYIFIIINDETMFKTMKAFAQPLRDVLLYAYRATFLDTIVFRDSREIENKL